MYVRIILRWIVKPSGTRIHGLDFPGSGRQPIFSPVYYNASVHLDSSLMLILFWDFALQRGSGLCCHCFGDMLSLASV